MKITSAEFLNGAVSYKQYPDSACPELAFVGRSNVGKSSLINSLLNRKKLVKTSQTPGKTQEINFFKINNCSILFIYPIKTDVILMKLKPFFQKKIMNYLILVMKIY
mgnify:CR=1 FL=1